MRLSTAAGLLALPVTLIAAIPAHNIAPEPFQTATISHRGRWRSLSDRLIESIWGRCRDERQPAQRAKESQAPPHTMARYGGDVVVRFNISSSAEAKSLAEAADTLMLDIWGFSEDWADIRLSKDIVQPLLGLLPQSLQHSHAPLLQERELAQAIYDTYPAPRSSPPAQSENNNPPSPLNRPFSPALGAQEEGGETNIFFSNYQPLSVIEPWMRLMASLFDTHVRKVVIGTTAQGRDIPALRVGVHPKNNDQPTPKRRTVVIAGGLHAREWISISTVNYVAYSLITGYGKNHAITRLLEAFDFVFVPTLNPDGYVYTWETDRLWRKNRQKTNFRFCQGIDIDRSFGYQWDGDVTTAGNPCSESFAGEAPYEAIEAKRLADWAKNETESNNVDFVGFLDLHSYSQQILYPYSYSCDDTPPGLENLEELAIGLEKAIRVSHGHTYSVSPACEGNTVLNSKGKKDRLWPRMEASGGSALDWFYGEMRVRFAYQIKLRDRGTYGFLLPKENIVPTGKEILDAVLYFGGFLQELYYSEGVAASVELAPAAEEKLEVETRLSDDGNDAVAMSEHAVTDGVAHDGLTVEDVQWELKRRRRR